MTTTTPDTGSLVRYQRTDQAEWSVGADGRMTVKDTASNWFYPLNDVATIVWDLLDGGHTIADITAAVCAEFDIDEETARADIDDFVEQALDLNLVERAAATPPQA